MQGALHLAVGSFHSALALRVILGVYLLDVAVGVLLASGTHHNICVLQSHLLAGGHAEEFLGCFLHEVLSLYPQRAAEGDGVRAVGLILGVVHGFHLLGLALGIVGDDEFHRIEHCRHAQRALVEVVPHGSLKQGVVVKSVKLCVSY